MNEYGEIVHRDHEMKLQMHELGPGVLRKAVEETIASFERVRPFPPQFLYLGKSQFNVALGDYAPWSWSPDGHKRETYLGLKVLPIQLTDHVAVS